MITKSDLSVDQHLFAAASEPARVSLAEVIREHAKICDEIAAEQFDLSMSEIHEIVSKRLREAFAAPTRETE